jgi:hypothetical protein
MPFQGGSPGSKRAATANETAPLLDRGRDDVVKRDRFPRPSAYEPDAPGRTGRLQTDLACSGWMPRQSSRLLTAAVGSSDDQGPSDGKSEGQGKQLLRNSEDVAVCDRGRPSTSSAALIGGGVSCRGRRTTCGPTTCAPTRCHRTTSAPTTSARTRCCRRRRRCPTRHRTTSALTTCGPTTCGR